MTDSETILNGLNPDIRPPDGLKQRVWHRIDQRIRPVILTESAQSVVPSTVFQQRVRQRILARTRLSDGIKSLASEWQLPMERARSLREAILSRLRPHHTSVFSFGLKWATAFVALLLVVRTLPLVLLAPVLQAETSVQLVPSGDVRVSIGGVQSEVLTSRVLTGPVLISTGPNAQATIILNDDGVFRLAPNTTLRLHDLGDRPHLSGIGPTATLVRGQVWVLGLLPFPFASLSLETSRGTIELNAGSVSVVDDGSSVTAAVYDKGVAFRYDDNKRMFLVSGERVIVRSQGNPYLNEMATALFSTPWVSVNLDQDAVHRADIAELQQERRQKMAGILPTSFLYPAKRIAEEVDVLFTLGDQARAEKRLSQADTRFSEALTLLQNGREDAATVPLTEYRDTLVAMASGTGDNLVQFLVKKQIDELSSSVAVATPENQLSAVQEAVLEVSSAIPNTNLKPRDIEGYVLVDKLAALNSSLTVSRNLTGALATYREIQSYLPALLAENSGVHPLLQREAKSLLVTTSALVADLQEQEGSVEAADILEDDIAQYLPPEPERVLITEEQLNAQVQKIVDHIFYLKMPRSRYNQLMVEMDGLKGNPDRGTLLRRLYRALPENGLAGYVRTEIQNLGDELKE